MASYLLDTNILLRLLDSQSASHEMAADSVQTLLDQGHSCCICPQVLIEFWAVATRPVSANGLGWGFPRTRREIRNMLGYFRLLPEPTGVLEAWRQIMETRPVIGKRAHDVRLLAVLQVNAGSHLLTFNPSDFPKLSGITVAHPSQVA